MELICCKTVEPLSLFNNSLFTVAGLGESTITVEKLDTGGTSATSAPGAQQFALSLLNGGACITLGQVIGHPTFRASSLEYGGGH